MCIDSPLQAQNHNVFGRSLGIEFPLTYGDTTKTAVCQVSSFEHASMFFPPPIGSLRSWLRVNTGPSSKTSSPLTALPLSSIVSTNASSFYVSRCLMSSNQRSLYPPSTKPQADLADDRPPPPPRSYLTPPLVMCYLTKRPGKMRTLRTLNVG